MSRFEIEWRKVAERFDGIIIAPYIWQRRLDLESSWYYSWDCASGCIWNASAVREIVPMYESLVEAAQTK
jgi:hypothetical protein